MSVGHSRGMEILPPVRQSKPQCTGELGQTVSPKRGIAENEVAGRQN